MTLSAEYERLDIDLDAGTAIIAWQLQQYDGHVVLCPPKTARRGATGRLQVHPRRTRPVRLGANQK
jgi:hypothetical protein